MCSEKQPQASQHIFLRHKPTWFYARVLLTAFSDTQVFITTRQATAVGSQPFLADSGITLPPESSSVLREHRVNPDSLNNYPAHTL